MRVLLTTAYHQGVALNYLAETARNDRFGVHQVVASPTDADCILFVENGERGDPFYKVLRAHPLVARYPDRVFMYNEYDFPYCALPGLYASMPKRTFDARRQAAFCYLFRPNAYVSKIFRAETERDLLASFVGAPNHRMRRRVLQLRDSRMHVEDTSAYSIWFKPDAATDEQRRRHYADIMARSNFILCPRGAGTSSFRLFETMEAGRTPVVIADEWVEPVGPDLNFIVRIREADVARTPEILKSHEAEARDRGQRARKVWEEWFAPDVVFHRAMEALSTLMPAAPRSTGWRRCVPDEEYARVRLSMAVMTRLRAARDGLRKVRSSFGRHST